MYGRQNSNSDVFGKCGQQPPPPPHYNYPPQFSGAPMPIGSALNGEGWGMPSWAWIIQFILILGITGIVIALIVKVGHIHPSKNVKECNDHNQCTIDYKVRGGCFSLDCPKSAECSSTCFESGDWSHCRKGECVGTGCKGQCSDVDDCPEIETSSLIGGFDTVVCRLGRCIYEKTEPTFLGYFTGCGGTLIEQECMALIDDDDPFKNCLTVDTFCTIDADKKRNAITDGSEEEEENGKEERTIDFIDRGCIFRFSCAEVILP